MLALDAAFPFDREAKMRQKHVAEQAQAQRLKIGIVGFGTFGQFLAKRMVQAGHEVRSLCAALRCAVLRVVVVLRFVVMHAECAHELSDAFVALASGPATDIVAQVVATSWTPYHDVAAAIGMRYFTNALAPPPSPHPTTNQAGHRHQPVPLP